MTETAAAPHRDDDTVVQMLCLRNDELLAEKEALAAQLDKAEAERDEVFAKGKQAFEDLRRVEAERAALAAYVEKLNSKLADINNSLYGQNLHIAGWHLNGDTEPMDTWFEENDWEPEPCGCTSLARLKAGWQASALEVAVITAQMKGEAEVAIWLQELADTCRRQAEGGE